MFPFPGLFACHFCRFVKEIRRILRRVLSVISGVFPITERIASNCEVYVYSRGKILYRILLLVRPIRNSTIFLNNSFTPRHPLTPRLDICMCLNFLHLVRIPTIRERVVTDFLHNLSQLYALFHSNFFHSVHFDKTTYEAFFLNKIWEHLRNPNVQIQSID